MGCVPTVGSGTPKVLQPFNPVKHMMLTNEGLGSESKNFQDQSRHSLKGAGEASDYLRWEDMGSEQMSVDTTKGNKHCYRADLRRTLKGDFFLTVMFGNTLVKLSILGSTSTSKREEVLVVSMTSLLKILNFLLFILSLKKITHGEHLCVKNYVSLCPAPAPTPPLVYTAL